MRVTISSTTSRPFRFDRKVYRIFRSDSTYSVRKKPKKTPLATAPCLLRSGALSTVSQPIVQRLIGRGSLVYYLVDLSFLSPLLVYLLLVPVYSPRLDSRQGELVEGIRPYHLSCRSTNSFLRRHYRIEASSARQQPIYKVDILLIQALTIVSTPYIDVTFRS